MSGQDPVGSGDRLEPQSVGEPGSDRMRDQVPQPTVAVRPVDHQQVEIIRPDPRRGVVLACLQPRTAEVAVDRDQVVELTPYPALVLPLPVRDGPDDVPHLPAGLLLQLPRQRLLRRLTRLEVSADDLPDSWIQPPLQRTALHVHTMLFVPDQRTYTVNRTHTANLIR